MLKLFTLFLVAISFTAVGGCSSGSSPGKTVSGWFGGSDEVPESDKSTFYAVAAGASVFAKAGADSRLLGKLEPHERVTKIGEAKGFVRIRARGGSMDGWVHKSKLVPRRPSQPPTRPGGSATTGIPATGDAPDATTVESPSGADDPHPDAATDASAAGPSDASADSPVEARPEPPAAEPEPAGPHKPRGVGASVFDPY